MAPPPSFQLKSFYFFNNNKCSSLVVLSSNNLKNIYMKREVRAADSFIPFAILLIGVFIKKK